MPIYQITCDECGRVEEAYRKIADIDKPYPECHGEPMRRMITSCAVIADISPYRSVVTGEYITGRSQHKEHLKRHNLVELGNDKITNKDYDSSKCDHDVRKELTDAVRTTLKR